MAGATSLACFHLDNIKIERQGVLTSKKYHHIALKPATSRGLEKPRAKAIDNKGRRNVHLLRCNLQVLGSGSAQPISFDAHDIASIFHGEAANGKSLHQSRNLQRNNILQHVLYVRT